ncbi:MAG: 3-oxoacyl-ACP reductase FabG [Clostridia bacterium]|nr:3-oxoacyl-ACP reductase FabG [Clostridia bacterium]
MRKILISGGSRGIGAACVRAFCAAGDAVAFLYRENDEAAAAVAAQTGAVAIRADITDRRAVDAALEQVREALGEIDVLVNCAGIGQIKLFTDLTDGDWHRMLDTHLSGAFYLCRALIPAMIRRGGGRIVNVGSMWGKTGASCEVHYSTAKAGLRGMTMALAKELGPSNITVNCIEPGLIDTEMNAALDEQTRSALCEETPLCRIGTPEDVAVAVMFFASEQASFITGQMLGVDGGYAI